MLEITTRIGCSLNCRFCPQHRLLARYSQGSQRPPVMPFETFRTCIDKLPQDEEIIFSGMAEPWLNPECSRMLTYAHESGHPLGVFTTLVGMTPLDYETLRAISPNTLCLHIPDAEGHAQFRWDDAYRTILNQALDDIITRRLKVGSFSCHGTVHPRIRDKVAQTGIEVVTEMHDRAGNLVEADVALDGQSFRHQETKPHGSLICTRCQGDGLFNNVLLPDGTVLLCCMDYGMDHPLGNLLEQDWREIAEGTAKQHCRQCLKSPRHGDIICRSCISGKLRWQWSLYQLRPLRWLWGKIR